MLFLHFIICKEGRKLSADGNSHGHNNIYWEDFLHRGKVHNCFLKILAIIVDPSFKGTVKTISISCAIGQQKLGDSLLNRILGI